MMKTSSDVRRPTSDVSAGDPSCDGVLTDRRGAASTDARTWFSGRRTVGIIALCCLNAVLLAAEIPEPRPPVPPNPVIVPQPPSLDGGLELDPVEAALKTLRERLAGHDRRIAELLTEIDGRTAPRPDLAGLDEARREREAALAKASAAAQDFIARRRANGATPVNAPSSDGSDALRALNRLAVADCYRRLVLEGGGDDEVKAGELALAEVDAALLGEADLPTLFYLRTWFLTERARRHGDPAIASQAHETARALLRDFPHSSLARTAQELVRDLPGGTP